MTDHDGLLVPSAADDYDPPPKGTPDNCLACRLGADGKPEYLVSYESDGTIEWRPCAEWDAAFWAERRKT